MADELQSIEDLILDSQGEKVSEGSAQDVLRKKQREIKIKELEKATQIAADDLGVPYVNLFGFSVSPEALSLIKEEDADSLGIICFFYDGSRVRIGALDPTNEEVLRVAQELVEKYFVETKIYLISENSFNYALKLYKAIPKVRTIIRGVEVTAEDLNKFSEKFSSFKDLQAEINQAKITDIVTMIMAAAVKTGASDIHIEVEEDAIKVRYRIDGVLHDVASVDKELWKRIISRLKILAKVKINITNKPQDGRFSILMVGDRIDIRVSFLPTNYGESVVMRLLRSTSVGLSFEDLGISGHAFAQLKREIERPNGMIITTGPTGSGKTTTLYAILKKLNKPETKIITIEDPIEYQLKGVNQSQTSEKYTFAQGLRSIVRQDHDVIMVGEIRDLETAEIAVQAALTGHLVLSTIHTNDAAGTIPRLLSMGTKPFLLAPSLNVMIGQRLVRKICTQCKEEAEISGDTLKKVKEVFEKLPADSQKKFNFDKLKFYQGKGCDACQGIGFKGRIGIYEIMSMDKKIENLILSGKTSEYDLRAAAAENGMIAMVQDGILKAIDGITSVAEVFRVAEE
ncbi:MAG: GspE/PulE family protein [Candidatus Falkowbacteria bacterium]|nr:GspE/PulE family protein [Candidatus Falkowbacteria bacterium]